MMGLLGAENRLPSVEGWNGVSGACYQEGEESRQGMIDLPFQIMSMTRPMTYLPIATAWVIYSRWSSSRVPSGIGRGQMEVLLGVKGRRQREQDMVVGGQDGRRTGLQQIARDDYLTYTNSIEFKLPARSVRQALWRREPFLDYNMPLLLPACTRRSKR